MAGNKVIFPGSDGKAHDVAFDSKSFTADGERLNVWSGEFHHWRLPGTDDWRDMFQRLRAGGFNAVSLCFFWGLHSTESGEFNFTGIKDIELLLTMAEEEGLYVIARPGLYANAEISTGGLPAYLTKAGQDLEQHGSRRAARVAELEPRLQRNRSQAPGHRRRRLHRDLPG